MTMRFFLRLSLAFFTAALGCGDSTHSTTAAGGSGTSAAGAGGTSAGGASTGGTSAGGASTGGSNSGGSTGGSNTGGSNTGGGTGGTSTCMPKTTDASKIGADCSGASVTCPAGYECWEFAGFALQHYCAILCEDTCECPSGTTCIMKSDKAKSWKECSPP
jgi:hypothetical protein